MSALVISISSTMTPKPIAPGRVRIVSDGDYLMACDNMKDNPVRMPLELACIDKMSSLRRRSPVQFFETRADLDAWLKWLDTPSEARPKVVSLVKPRTG